MRSARRRPGAPGAALPAEEGEFASAGARRNLVVAKPFVTAAMAAAELEVSPRAALDMMAALDCASSPAAGGLAPGAFERRRRPGTRSHHPARLRSRAAFAAFPRKSAISTGPSENSPALALAVKTRR